MDRVADHLLAIRRNGYWEFDGLRIIFLELRRLFSNLPVGPPIEVLHRVYKVAVPQLHVMQRSGQFC